MRQPAVNISHRDSYVLCNSILQNMPLIIDPSLKGLTFDLSNGRIVYKDDKLSILKDRKDATREQDLGDTFRYLLNTFYGDFVRFNI